MIIWNKLPYQYNTFITQSIFLSVSEPGLDLNSYFANKGNIRTWYVSYVFLLKQIYYKIPIIEMS